MDDINMTSIWHLSIEFELWISNFFGSRPFKCSDHGSWSAILSRFRSIADNSMVKIWQQTKNFEFLIPLVPSNNFDSFGQLFDFVILNVSSFYSHQGRRARVSRARSMDRLGFGVVLGVGALICNDIRCHSCACSFVFKFGVCSRWF